MGKSYYSERGRIRRKLVREVETMLADGGNAVLADRNNWGDTARRSLEKLLQDYPVTIVRHNERWWVVKDGS